jgi:RNA polymerase sigma-B factor
VDADQLHQPDSWYPSRGEVVGFEADGAPWSVIVDQLDPAVVLVTVTGEIDKLTEPALQEHLSRLLVTRPERLIIDLSEVHFLGAAGLSVLMSVRHAATDQGTSVQLRAPHRRMVARCLEITGMQCLFEILPPATGGDEPESFRSSTHQGAPRPRDAEHHRVGSATSGSMVEPEKDEYAHLAPLQRRYAELAADEPERQRLRDALIRGYLPVAAHIARRFAGRGEPLDDLIQVATAGLVNAVDRFEPARGSHFLSFAVPTITGELRRYFRDHGWSTRVPRRLKDLSLAIRNAQGELSQQLGRAAKPSEVAEWLEVPTSKVIEALHAGEAYRSSSLDEMLSYGDTADCLGDLDPQMCLIDDRETLRTLLAELAPRQRTILALRFFHQLTQTQIAEQVGISQMHVSRVLRQTLTFLRERMTTDG